MPKRILLLFVSFLTLLTLFGSISSIKAACWCENGAADGCRCDRKGNSPYSYTYSYSGFAAVPKTVTIFCDTKLESRSQYATGSPICGNSPEIIPFCAYRFDQNTHSIDKSQVTCYGTQWVFNKSGAGNTNVESIKDVNGSLIPENSLKQLDGNTEVFFNGLSFGKPRQLFWCNSVAFCCSRGDEDPPGQIPPKYYKCADPGLCTGGANCSNQPDETSCKLAGCRYSRCTGADRCANYTTHGSCDSDTACAWLVDPKDPNPPYYCDPIANPPPAKPLPMCSQPGGKGESRLFFPHLKGISALSSLLQSMYNPAPASFYNNALPVPPSTTPTVTCTNTAGVVVSIATAIGTAAGGILKNDVATINAIVQLVQNGYGAAATAAVNHLKSNPTDIIGAVKIFLAQAPSAKDSFFTILIPAFTKYGAAIIQNFGLIVQAGIDAQNAIATNTTICNSSLLGLGNKDAVTTKIQYHQGADDNTSVVNYSDNNSSVIVDKPAPSPLYSFGDTSSPYKQSAYCSIQDSRVNPGDDLLGPRITATLRYTQKYTYEALPKANGCKSDNETAAQESDCCSFQDKGIPAIHNTDGSFTCGTIPWNLYKTEGRAVIFTKSPLVEYIYDTLVVGPQSVLRRIFPQGIPEQFKEVPSEAKYVATASNADQLKIGNDSGNTPTIYIPHLGSLYDYFLQGLQKAIRPFGFSAISDFAPPTGDCYTVAAASTNQPSCPSPKYNLTANPAYACLINSEMRRLIDQAASTYGVPPEIIAAILSVETRNGVFGVTSSEIINHTTYQSYTAYLCAPNFCGAMGAMQLLTGYGVQSSCPQAANVNRWSQYSCNTAGNNPNPGNLRDSIMAGAKMIRNIAGGAPTSGKWSQQDVFRVANSYYGNCTSAFNLKADIDQANACLPATIKPSIFDTDMTYCDYLWYYYAPRAGIKIIPPKPTPAPSGVPKI